MKSGICFSAAVSAILWLGVETPLACGGDPCESGNYLFNADVLHDSSAAAFFRDRCQSLFSCSDRWWDNLGMFTVHNVQEWMAFLANGLPDTLVSAILYNSSIPQIDSALLILKGTIPISAAPPLFADLLHDSQPGRIREFLYYLGFARRCEPWVASVPDWQAGPPDSAAVDSATGKLVEGALRQIKNVKNAFVKERYHFQIIRLHFAAKRYAACAAHFREHAAAFTVSPSMKYRSMSYVAGSYHRLRQFTEANCWYARVYRAYPPLRCVATNSFHPQSDTAWTRTLAAADNDEIRTVLWFLLGLYGNPQLSMEKIYAVNPSSDLLGLLCVRAVNIAEENYATPDAPGPFAVDKPLRKFVTGVADRRRNNKPWVWDLAAAHLLAYSGEISRVDHYLKKARTSRPHDSLVAQQEIVTRLVAQLCSRPEITRQFESAMHKALTQAPPWAIDWARARLGALYATAGNAVKARLLDGTSGRYDDNAWIEELISFLSRKHETPFDSLITSPAFLERDANWGAAWHTEELREIQALNAVFQENYKEAAKYLKAAGEKAEHECVNPFTGYMKDWLSLHPLSGDDTADVARLEVVRRLAVYQKATRGGGTEAAEAHYRIGNFWSNTSEFGVSWPFFETPTGHFAHRLPSFPPDHFHKALEHNPDKELRARIYAMLAKTELYNTEGRYSYDPFGDHLDKFYKARFKDIQGYRKLKSECSGTAFYAEMIRECGYFRRFLGKK